MAVTVDSYDGIAFHEPDKCEIHENCLIAVMVGDDRKNHVSKDTVHDLGDDEYCGSCGQIGCGW